MSTPKGIKKINEKIIQDGRALIITEEEASAINWANIPAGSIKVNPTNGIMSTKLEGESDWVPAGIRNDGTICIAKDSKFITEIFTVVTPDNGDQTFTYENSVGERRTKPLTIEGYPSFELEEGSYVPRRNCISIKIDGVLHRSAETDSLDELDAHRFALKEKVVAGAEIQATYIEKFKVGNPMPRIFIGAEHPDVSDYADLWLDTNGTISDNEFIENNTNIESQHITWANIDGKPTTIAGYNIVDFAHRHSVSDIDGLNAFNGVAPHSHTKAEITDFSHTHQMTDIEGLGNHTHTTAQITGFASHRHNVETLDGLETIIAIPAGIITMWSGAAAAIPAGWALCNGQNGTPNLIDRFIVGAGNSYPVGTTGGESNHTLTIEEIPTHTHTIQEGTSARSTGQLTSGDDYTGNAAYLQTSGAAGGGLAHNNMPPFYALCYIMKL